MINGSLYESNGSGGWVVVAKVPDNIRKIEDAVAWYEGGEA